METLVVLLLTAGGPASFGLPVELSAGGPGGGGGERLRLEGPGGALPLQWRWLAGPSGPRRWALLRTAAPGGRVRLLRGGAGAVGPVPPARPLDAGTPLDLWPLQSPCAAGLQRLWAEVEEEGPVARVLRGRYEGEGLALEARVVRYATGGAEFTLRVEPGGGGQHGGLGLALLPVQGAGPRVLRGGALAEGGFGRLSWVQRAQRGQEGFQSQGRGALVVPVLSEDTTLALGESARVDLQLVPPGRPLPEDRFAHVRAPPPFWRRHGLLPAEGVAGEGRAARERLVEAAQEILRLRPTGGPEFGNFPRPGEGWTNLEYDTAFGLQRLEMAGGPPWLLRGALDAVLHWNGRLLAGEDDAVRGLVEGLPFVHGSRPRSGRGEVGHVWLAGAFLAGLRAADPFVLQAARGAADALATRVLEPAGIQDLARNLGWPLLELETVLRWDPSPLRRRAADTLAARLVRRFDTKLGAFRFREGERPRTAAYLERAWLTGGILLPALAAHCARVGEESAAARVLRQARAVHAGRSLCPSGRPRSHVLLDRGTGQPRGEGSPCEGARGLFVAEGWPASSRPHQRAAAALLRRPMHPGAADPATEFSMAARLDLVVR